MVVGQGEETIGSQDAEHYVPTAAAASARGVQEQRQRGQKSATSDKRSFIEGLAEEAARQGQLGTVFKIPKHLCGNHIKHSARVIEKSGNSLIFKRK